MSIYDINGNNIGASSSDIEDAFMGLVASGEINLGSQVGATLTYNNLTSAWIANATSSYNSMKARYKELSNESIPFGIKYLSLDTNIFLYYRLDG